MTVRVWVRATEAKRFWMDDCIIIVTEVSLNLCELVCGPKSLTVYFDSW